MEVAVQSAMHISCQYILRMTSEPLVPEYGEAGITKANYHKHTMRTLGSGQFFFNGNVQMKTEG